MIAFKNLLKEKVGKLMLVVWPPWGEERESEISISLGFVFQSEPNRLCLITVDENELWSPHTKFESIPANTYQWEDFYPRMKMWMKAEDDDLIIDTEYYDVTNSEFFTNIIGNEIVEIEFLSIEGIPEPFGVKILFKDDYIIFMPNSDGSTVETKSFNKNDGIENFKHLGNVIYSKL
jgi:hypothetical protein